MGRRTCHIINLKDKIQGLFGVKKQCHGRVTKAWGRPLLLALLRNSATVESISCHLKGKEMHSSNYPQWTTFFSLCPSNYLSFDIPHPCQKHSPTTLNLRCGVLVQPLPYEAPQHAPPLPGVPVLHVRHHGPRSVGRHTRGHCTRLLARPLFEYSGHDAFCSYIGLCCCAGHGRFVVGRWVAGIDALGH